MSYNNQYIITNVSESNSQYGKGTGIEQLPIIFSVNGVFNIREKKDSYKLTIGK
jgi:hypothetical protein